MSLQLEKIDLKLGRAEAVVLFELLADVDHQACLDLHSPAHRLALIRLHGALEACLVEPFMPDYQALIDEARQTLAAEAKQVSV